MPTVGHPQIFNVPDNTAAYAQLGQGGGQLLAALLKYYRNRGGGTYTSPTGASATISPAETQLSQMLAQRASQGQGSYTPNRMSWMGEIPVDVAKVLPKLQLKQAQAELAKSPYEIANIQAETSERQSRADLNKKVSEGGGIVTMDETGNVVAANPADPTQRQFRLSKNGGLVPIEPSLNQKAAQEDRIAKQKKRREISENLKRLTRAEQQIISLYQRADKIIPPIAAQGPMVPIEALGRSTQMFTGFAEKQKGFEDTFPIQAREQLQELETGGRYTNQDVDQIIQGTAPKYRESRIRREAKLAELLNRFRSERTSYQAELDALNDELGDEEQNATEDFSTYTDEELKAIAAGQ